jgi:DNA modification methylase
MSVRIIVGDCREKMAEMEPASVDAIVCDPPYALTNRVVDEVRCSSCDWVPGGSFGSGKVGDACSKCGGALTRTRIHRGGGFMGKGWDASLPGVDVWIEAYRVLKPGGHLLAFGGTRTHHRLMVAIEDAGFEIRDCLMWLYGSGFPKSLDVSKAIDKAAGALQNEGVGFTVAGFSHNPKLLTTAPSRGYVPPAPATEAAREWDGWGTALKPAWEPIVMARKPLAGTVAANVQAFGTGALNIDACRIEGGDAPMGWEKPRGGIWQTDSTAMSELVTSGKGRWPANVVLDEDAAALLDAQSGETKSVPRTPSPSHHFGSATSFQRGSETSTHNDTGGASRFFKTVNGRDGEASADKRYTDEGATNFAPLPGPRGGDPSGRWPANVVLDEDAAALLDAQSGERKSAGMYADPHGEKRHGVRGGDMDSNLFAWNPNRPRSNSFAGDTGGASRFFFVARDNVTLDSEAGIIDAWERPDQSHNEQTATTSPLRDTYAATSMDGFGSLTLSNGNGITVPSQTDTNSITATETSKTTESKTSNSSPPPTTSASTQDANGGMVSGSNRAESAGSSNPLTQSIGISANRDGPSTDAAGPATFGKSLPINSDDAGTRFHYTAKASRSERNKGLGDDRNVHPTVKSLDLMQWLVRLVTPPGGTVLDPFAGSGSTLVAADREGFNAIGIELDPEYAEIARRRVFGDAPLFAEVLL